MAYKRDDQEIRTMTEDIASWGNIDETTAADIVEKYHKLVETVLEDRNAFFQEDFIAKYTELRDIFETVTDVFRLVTDYSNNRTLIPYILAEDGQFLSPCLYEE